MKFEIKNLKWGCYMYDKSSDGLIEFGEFLLKKENYKDKSWCAQTDSDFDYQGIENALCGKITDNNPFTPKRFIIIQMI